MIFNFEKLKESVRLRLPEKRYIHSIGVASEVEFLSKRLEFDLEKALIAALLHDITKPWTKDEQLNYCKKNGIILGKTEAFEPKLMHAVTSAHVAECEFGVSDSGILSAIRYHTTAKADMTNLELAVFLADFIEPNRDYIGVEMLRGKISRNIDEGLLAALDFSIKEVMAKGGVLHPDTVAARNCILMR